jgi:DMSO reductase anchor subunit
MHPAFSVIFLTTLIGTGQGLFLALYTGQVYSLANLLPAQEGQSFYALGSLLSLGLLAAGLVASFFHLGHPERGWRAASQWRTSWLSREVIALPVFMALVLAFAVVHWFGWTQPWFVVKGHVPVDASLVIGFLASVVAFLLYFFTAMIYASLRFLQEWHHWLTAVNYTLLGIASGFLLTAAFAAWLGVDLVVFYGTWGAVFTVAAAVTRGASLYRNTRIQPKSSARTAIGVRHTQVQQRAQGFMGGSFNTREFFHGRSAATLRGVRAAFLVLVFVAPLVLLAGSYLLGSPYLPLAAFGVQYLGLLAERWYFFAEARHPQNLYYQSMA